MQPELIIPASCRLRVLLHGPLAAFKRSSDGMWKPVVWGQSRNARMVFRRLLAAPGRRLSRGRLADDLWPESDGDAADASIQVAISLVRSAIGKDLVTTWDGGYEIAGQALVWLDLDAADALLKTAENEDYTSSAALPQLEEALSYLERGLYLEEEAGAWCYASRTTSETLLRKCRRWLAEHYEGQSKFFQAGMQYRALLRMMPPDENALQRWMRMLHQQGETAEARTWYQEVKTFAEEEGFLLSSATERVVETLDHSSRITMFSPQPFDVINGNSPFVQDTIPLAQDILLSKGPNAPMDLLRRKILQEAGMMLFPLFSHSKKSSLAWDEVVSYGNTIIQACWHLMKGKEIHTAEELLGIYTPGLLDLAIQTSPFQRAIAQIATQACMIRAIIAKHHLHPIAREMYCHEAISCSRLADDKALHAGALMYLGYTYTFCDPLRPQKAIETFLEALKELGNADSLVKSDICIGLADAYALVNDETQAKCAIQAAQDCFPSHPEQSTSFFYADCAQDTLYQWEAKTYLDLAQHEQQQSHFRHAWNILEQSTCIRAVSERCSVETIIYQASAALGLRNLDTYAFLLKEGASIALQMGSQRRYQEAIALFRQAPKDWIQEQKMQELSLFFQEQSRQEKHA